MLISECVKRFLEKRTYYDLAALYTPEMELQIIVARDEGTKIESDFRGRSGDSFTDNITTWSPIRIPKNAYSNPENNDKEIWYDLDKHALGIGCTGWNFQKKVSHWVGYDFDSICGHSEKHSKKLNDLELKEIEEIASKIPWVTIRRSTSGNGRHWYIYLNDVPTENHNQHKALARAVLGILSAKTGYDFELKVDALGGVLWFWHRKMEGTNGLELIKQGSILKDIPENWKDHLVVVSGKKKQVVPFWIESVEEEKEFLELIGQKTKIPFDDEHKKLLSWLQENGHSCIYNQDLHLLITHTHSLKEAHKVLRLKGIFDTIAEGREKGDHNCWANSLRGGAWSVRRYTKGIQESNNWEQNPDGYTTCLFNKDPDLRIAAKTNKGLEDIKGGFVFTSPEDAQKASIMLGVDLNLPSWTIGKKTILKRHSDGRLIAKVEHDAQRDSQHGGLNSWYIDGKFWNKLFNSRIPDPGETEIANFDETLRHLLSPTDDDAGWSLKVNSFWQREPLSHISKVLKSMNYKVTEVDAILGACIIKSWRIVNKPFESEYPGNRQWNRNAAQLRYIPLENKDYLSYPTWTKFLNHLGNSLNEALKINKWAIEHNIITGADYLKCWIASLFQFPSEPLPYLFLYGAENTGKSSLHEALGLLMIGGIRRADVALMSQGSFTAALENAILCVVEEVDLKKNRQALNKIKDFVTSPIITIHPKGIDEYDVPNKTHWLQCANVRDALPIFPGDTRVVVIYVDILEEIIPKKKLFTLLEKEAQDFLTAILSLEIPPSPDRLNIPVIETQEKLQLQESNQTELERFIKENLFHIDGSMVKFSEFYDRFINTVDPNEAHLWSKIRVSRELPIEHCSGAVAKESNQKYIANLSWSPWDDTMKKKPKLILRNGNLVPITS